MIDDVKRKPWFLRQLSLDSLVQTIAIIVAGVIWGSRIEARMAALEQVKQEMKLSMESNYKELRDAQTRLTEQVTRLIVMEEMRQRQTKP